MLGASNSRSGPAGETSRLRLPRADQRPGSPAGQVERALTLAIEEGRMDVASCELLLGFVRGHELGWPAPSRPTWYRRQKELVALGLVAPPMSEALVRQERTGELQERRQGERRGGDRRGTAL